MADTGVQNEDGRSRALPLDENLYTLDEETSGFFMAQTGIQDAEELRKHLLRVQAEAYAVFPYPCIRGFLFLQLKQSQLPAYKRLLVMGRERQGAILLDIGCCFGNDIRKAVYDGYPIENIVGSDLRSEFWELGHGFFKSTPTTFPVPFIAGDVFDTAHLASVPPLRAPPDGPIPELSTLTSLNPLRGHVSAIHASAFFHLFSEEKQLQLARKLAGLLSPVRGSMILGWHVGRPEKGFRYEVLPPHRQGNPMFCHSAESWKEMWEGQVFGKDVVKVEAELREEAERRDWKDMPGVAPGAKFYALVWSVTRL
ncbi:uncharacterized protein TRAVEDRAFT_42402 [Trametes versicolor FP-101664 SS1]|uniref:uncharacterized protein n=1 Tax=Trametes versicolor (strain FP-101664) TaxID=717944 RepID=UPI0004622CDC|nr:uncharacterized protein TRAVEDRAFT_42402 [Trametes versicolor FP-101664 SS1]EIW65003.1 hypothetical protein TRAVEDRAFT_42402 [Trametes versicolor FP-101664 SS1]